MDIPEVRNDGCRGSKLSHWTCEESTHPLINEESIQTRNFYICGNISPKAFFKEGIIGRRVSSVTGTVRASSVDVWGRGVKLPLAFAFRSCLFPPSSILLLQPSENGDLLTSREPGIIAPFWSLRARPALITQRLPKLFSPLRSFLPPSRHRTPRAARFHDVGYWPFDFHSTSF